MLFAEPTPKGAGVFLWGDYHDPRSVYNTVRRAVDVAPEGICDFIVGLNYDIRHAYEHRREVKEFGHDEIDNVTYLGEKILWPTALVQTSLVRPNAVFLDSSKEHQANLYRLEHALQQALRNYDAEVSDVCADWLDRPLALPKDYLAQFLDELAHRFVTAGPGGKKRFMELPTVLRSVSPGSEEYRTFKAELERIAKKRAARLTT